MLAWDVNKSRKNEKKYGFLFDEILDVFDDLNLLDWSDKEHSNEFEDRYQCIGCLERFLVGCLERFLVILIVITDL